MHMALGSGLNAFRGNTIATTHAIVGPRMRATASAVLFLIINIIGLGAGPWAVNRCTTPCSIC